jgi:phage N-6-adenine-methyltransferase
MTGLVRYDAACRAIAEAKSLDEVKDIRDKVVALQSYARIAKNRQLEVDAAEIRFRAERRVGEMMAEQPKNEGTRYGGVLKTPPPTLADAGIDKNLAKRARAYAAVPVDVFESDVAEWRENVAKETARVETKLFLGGEKNRQQHNSGEVEWYTPEQWIAMAREVMGGIDLDPASSAVANNVVQAAQYYTKDDDGLSQPWAGRVFLNPPYSQPLIAKFIGALVDNWKAGNLAAAILLTNDCTDTEWFHVAAEGCAAMAFPRGRIRFSTPEGEAGSPLQGQTFFYFGNEIAKFKEVFMAAGVVVGRV